MSNVIVLQNDESAATTAVTKTPRLAWQNALVGASSAPASSGALYDNITSVLYTAGSATETLDFTLSSSQSITCCGVAGAQFGQFATTFEFYTWNGSTWVKQAELSGMRNNQPVFLSFDSVTTAQVRFKFISNTTGLTIGELFTGSSLEFPKPVSVGYRPGKWASKDKVSNNDTQANAFGRSTVIQRGTEERVSIPNITYQWMNANWADFVRDAQGYPVWFSWDSVSFPTDVIYGRWEANAPSFRSSLYSEISLTIKGQV